MSGEAPSGNNDPGKAPLLGFHWAVVGSTYCIFTACAFYTQYQLYALKYSKQACRLQMLLSPDWISVALLCLFLYSIPPLIYGAAIQPIPCVIYALIPQICSAGMTAIEIFVILSFTKRLSEVQSRKQFLLLAEQGRNSSNGVLSNEGSVSTTKNDPLKYARFIGTVASTLQGKRVNYICATLFVFFVSTILYSSDGREQLANTAEVCTIITSTFVIFGWLIFTALYLLFLRKFRLIDPFCIFFKMKVITITTLFAFVGFFVLELAVEPAVGTPHTTLFGNQIVFGLLMTLWYLESYIPLMLTRKNIQLAKRGNKYDVLDTLTNPDLLVLFEQHLIEEWSIETLEFVQSVLIFEIVGNKSLARTLKKKAEEEQKDPLSVGGSYAEIMRLLSDSLQHRAYELFITYVQEGAAKQVNFSAEVLAPLQKHFYGPSYDRFREKDPDEFTEVDNDRMLDRDHVGIRSRSLSRTAHQAKSTPQSPQDQHSPQKAQFPQNPQSPIDKTEATQRPKTPSRKRTWLDDSSAPVSQAGSLIGHQERSKSPGPRSIRVKTSSNASPVVAPAGTATAMQFAQSPSPASSSRLDQPLTIEEAKLATKTRGSSIFSSMLMKVRKSSQPSILGASSEHAGSTRLKLSKRGILGLDSKRSVHQRQESSGMSIRKEQVKRFCDLLTNAALQKLRKKKDRQDSKRRPSVSSVVQEREERMERGEVSTSKEVTTEIKHVLKVFDRAKLEVLNLMQNDSHARFIAKLNKRSRPKK